jgi:hypothetical protein
MLQHYVFMKFKLGVEESHLDAFCEKMLALKKLIPEVVSLKIGQDILHDARSWDLVLIMEFESIENLRAYQKHPEHQAVMQFNDPFVAEVASIDFEKSLSN